MPSSQTPLASLPSSTALLITSISSSLKAKAIASAKANRKPPLVANPRRQKRPAPKRTSPHSLGVYFVITDCQLYVETVLALYLKLPDTPHRHSCYDRRLATQLHQQNVPLAVVEAAFLL